MIILGVSAFHGDCSAALLKNGQLIAAVEEERFTRVKHWAGFPENAIAYCLEEGKVKLEDVDYISVSRDPKANFTRRLFYLIRSPSAWKKLGIKLKQNKTFQGIEEIFAKRFAVAAEKIMTKIQYVEHHKSHLGGTYFISPFKESAVVSIDGFGDFVSAMYGRGAGNRLDIQKRVCYPHSIGLFYSMMTQYLGFKKYGDEYKVMGLASYGKGAYVEKMAEIISYKGKGDFALNLKYFRHHKIKLDFQWESGEPQMPDLFTDKLIELFGPARSKSDEVTGHHKDIAASLQQHTENIIFKMLNYAHGEMGSDNLCLSGGVAMNSVANGKIFSRTPFKEVYIPPAAGDAGNSLGAAFYTWNEALGKSRNFVLETGYWGPGFNEKQIENTVQAFKDKLGEDEFVIERVSDEKRLLEKTVDCILEGDVVGWFQGRMEFGARALGNRSIVVDPRRKDMMDILNARIKKREPFRPFAPSILIEKVREWFEQSYGVPFMEKVYEIKKDMRERIPAVTHIDGTGRLQTVHESQNPLYYNLIKTFEHKTGVPILLNTSFNENEPIVCTPAEALSAFLRTKMDVVVLGRTIIKRQDSHVPLHP